MKQIVNYLEQHKKVRFTTIEKMLLKRGFECVEYHNGEAFYDKGCFRIGLYYVFDKNGKASTITDWFWHPYAAN